MEVWIMCNFFSNVLNILLSRMLFIHEWIHYYWIIYRIWFLFIYFFTTMFGEFYYLNLCFKKTKKTKTHLFMHISSAVALTQFFLSFFHSKLPVRMIVRNFIVPSTVDNDDRQRSDVIPFEMALVPLNTRSFVVISVV